MKRLIFVCSIAMLTFLGSLAVAQDGFKGPGPDLVTVKAVKNLKDDYPVLLRGKIERSLGDEKYLFADETGSIIIEIENELWNGISVDENDTVEITGEVDKGINGIEIEASIVKKI
ncbi:MAG: NirD/YgiW/YdeI family stress tolerance protein [Spirochaetaceae bacterium]|jgi:uncharacterized protein (TIGR00156 family)|nr:NirD/YgiW/YdeI family stress tolerance protein [Spirochaetaceae bacterium]